MSLWETDVKPKNLTEAEKLEVYQTNQGWVREAGSRLSGNGNVNADPEVLVAISGLATKSGTGNITEIEFITTSVSAASAGPFSVRVRFNEKVDVDTSGGMPTLLVTNSIYDNASTSQALVSLDYASGTGTNELTFTGTWASGQLNENDVLSIGSNAVALNSGTIKDAGTATNSTITNSAAIGTAAGTLTVAA